MIHIRYVISILSMHVKKLIFCSFSCIYAKVFDVINKIGTSLIIY